MANLSRSSDVDPAQRFSARAGSVTLLTPLPIWDRLLHCRPAVAHGVFDLGPAQTDVGQNAVIKLLKRSRGILQIQLVSLAACEFPKISRTISERGREIDCNTLQIRSHERGAGLACPAHKLVGRNRSSWIG